MYEKKVESVNFYPVYTGNARLRKQKNLRFCVDNKNAECYNNINHVKLKQFL